MGNGVSLERYQPLKLRQTGVLVRTSRSARTTRIRRVSLFARIVAVFAASFAFTLLSLTLSYRASEARIDERSARAVLFEIQSHGPVPNAAAQTQVPAKRQISTPQVRNAAASRLTLDPDLMIPFGASHSNLALTESALELGDWERVRNSHDAVDLQTFLAQYPNGPHAQAAAEAIQRVQWDTVDKQNPSSLQAYLEQSPKSAFSAEARQRLADVLRTQQIQAEEDAWKSLDQTRKESVESFLARYPDAGHASDARQLLDGLSNQRARESALARDAHAAIAALEKYSDAWNAKDLGRISAMRPGLGRRTLKEQLAGARYIAMHIHPLSAPRIEGDRATVECIHQVDQVFSDGIEKQNPGVKVTYVLVRRGEQWLIEDSR
jgi:hypothetical protein